MSVFFPIYTQVFPKLEQIGEIGFSLDSTTDFIEKKINRAYNFTGGLLEEQIDEGRYIVSSSLDANKTYRYVGVRVVITCNNNDLILSTPIKIKEISNCAHEEGKFPFNSFLFCRLILVIFIIYSISRYF